MSGSENNEESPLIHLIPLALRLKLMEQLSSDTPQDYVIAVMFYLNLTDEDDLLGNEESE